MTARTCPYCRAEDFDIEQRHPATLSRYWTPQEDGSYLLTGTETDHDPVESSYHYSCCGESIGDEALLAHMNDLNTRWRWTTAGAVLVEEETP